MKHLLLIALLSPTLLFSQKIDDVTYLFPINPGQRNYLAGTFAEIRGSHFHTGIDIKTNQRTGLPVYATADGYISRVKISPTGYGNALYMHHTNGTTSVYGHLKSFEKKIASWVTNKQYEKESFKVDLFPQRDQFAFKKGDIIAYSGNSGSSSGPHLHFEIRDRNNMALDALSLGFSEIKDTRPPALKKIAFITLDKDARVNDFFGRQEFELIKTSGIYSVSVPIHLEGKIGIEIYAYDPMDGVSNKNGIIESNLFIDGKKYFGEVKKKLSFAKQRSILVHINYSATKKGSKKFNRLYKADGNEQSIYTTANKGIYFNTQKKIEILTTDDHNNTSTINITLADESPDTKPWISAKTQYENIMHLRSASEVAIKQDKWTSIAPYKTSGKDQYFLWDLRDGLPSELLINGDTIPTHLVGSIPPNQKLSYIQKEFELSLTEKSLFDTLYLGFEKSYNATKNLEFFSFKNYQDPIRSSIKVTLKPDKNYATNAAVFSNYGKNYYYQGGTWSGNTITFSTRDLGNYTILSDTIPPNISPQVVNKEKVSFRISDKLSGIKSYRAEIDGAFILMAYDPRKNLIWSKKRNENIPFQGEFILEVKDQSNNISTYKKNL